MPRSKRISTPVLVLACAVAAPDLAAQVRIGFQAGLVSSTLGGEAVASLGSRTGVTGGAFLAVPLSRVVTLQPGAAWIEKGVEETAFDVTDRIAFSYIALPLLVRFTLPSEVSVAAHAVLGPVLNVEMSCAVESESNNDRISVDCRSPLLQGGIPTKSTDIGFQFGGGVTILPRNRVNLVAQVAYELGLTSIDDSTPQFDVKNRAIIFSAGVTYAIGQ
jgi:hypothetical protein